MKVCILGIGEAGSAYASDLVSAQVAVAAYDPKDVATPAGVLRCGSATDAIKDAQLVLALTAAVDAPVALRQVIAHLEPGVLYADLSTGTADLKQSLASEAAAHHIDFVDVALMSPVPGRGIRTPALACGSGAERFVSLVTPLGFTVEFDGETAGRSATRKLLRSIVMKGLAALVIESMNAAHAAGLDEETWQNIVEQLTAADEAFLRRLVTGTAPHAERRLHEMEAAAQMIRELALTPTMTDATVASLAGVVAGHTEMPRSLQ